MAESEKQSTQKSTGAEPLSKMTSGAEELRDHDFPLPVNADRSSESVIVDTGKPPHEAVQSSGPPGSCAGDVQKVGEAPTIMNQDGVQPDFQAEMK